MTPIPGLEEAQGGTICDTYEDLRLVQVGEAAARHVERLACLRPTPYKPPAVLLRAEGAEECIHEGSHDPRTEAVHDV